MCQRHSRDRGKIGKLEKSFLAISPRSYAGENTSHRSAVNTGSANCQCRQHLRKRADSGFINEALQCTHARQRNIRHQGVQSFSSLGKSRICLQASQSWTNCAGAEQTSTRQSPRTPIFRQNGFQREFSFRGPQRQDFPLLNIFRCTNPNAPRRGIRKGRSQDEISGIPSIPHAARTRTWGGPPAA